jgi:hypothetical protein
MNPVHSATATDSAAERAAQAIVELINSRPRSPRPDEIAAIIKRLALSGTATASCPHCEGLDREYGPARRRFP